MIWVITGTKNEYDSLTGNLLHEMFKFSFLKTIYEASDKLKKEIPEAIIIDIDESPVSGLEFCGFPGS
jgi:DNA-binding response OmpR family regulator